LWRRSGVCLALSACAPSYNVVYEGDARFEHCYALDDSPYATMEQKSACWRDWTEHHTLGQTRDKIEYAQARWRAIERAPEMPTDEAMMAAAPGVGARDSNQLTAPLPTSAFAPPPRTDTDGALPQTRTTTTVQSKTTTTVVETKTVQPKLVPLPRAPGSECVEACTQAWDVCHTECSGNKEKCDVCEDRHETCLLSCVKNKARVPRATRSAKGH
jgi:hypothetical protein